MSRKLLLFSRFTGIGLVLFSSVATMYTGDVNRFIGVIASGCLLFMLSLIFDSGKEELNDANYTEGVKNE